MYLGGRGWGIQRAGVSLFSSKPTISWCYCGVAGGGGRGGLAVILLPSRKCSAGCFFLFVRDHYLPNCPAVGKHVPLLALSDSFQECFVYRPLTKHKYGFFNPLPKLWPPAWYQKALVQQDVAISVPPWVFINFFLPSVSTCRLATPVWKGGRGSSRVGEG